MPHRPSLLLVTSWLILPGMALAQGGGELTPEKVAEIRREDSQARAKVDAEFGNRKPSEMSSEERALAIEKQQAASAAVMEKHGVSEKDYARYEARMGPEANARAKAEEKRLEEQAAQAAKQAEPTGEKAAEDVAVVNGFSDDDPVELEATEGADPVVDVGIPGAQEAAAIQVEQGDGPQDRPAKRAAARSSGVKKKKSARRQRGSDE